MTLLSCVEVNPEATEACVIWLHGLGASGHDFEPIAAMLQLPKVRFVFPHAPMRPVTINAGYVMRAWYDIKTLAESELREDEADIHAATEQIEALIQAEKDRGFPSHRILLAGFSQGAAMALHVAHRHPEPLAGIMVLSGYLLLEGSWEEAASPANATTPMLFCHGEYDEVVPCHRGQQALERFQHSKRPTRWESYPMGHEVCPPEIAHIRAWLHERLAV
jgi:phospholipase/carboxylesterase